MRLAVLVLCVLLCIALQRARAQENVTGASGEDDGQTAMESADEELDYMQLLRNTVAGGFANMPVALRRRLLSADVTPECNVGLLRFMRAMQNLEPWALRLLDASGKFPSGLLQGSRVDLGAFDECLETEIYDTYGDVLMRGQYCNLLVYNENSTAAEGKIQTFSNVLHPKLKYFSNYFSVEELPVIRMGICSVDECNQRDLQALVDAVKPPLVRLEVSNCVTGQVEPWTNAQIGIMMFLCVLLVIIIAATLTDRLMKLKPKLMEKYGALGDLVKGFSATSNTRMLLKVAEKSNTDHYALQFLHGMRFFSIVHIVFCHCGQTMSDNWSRYLNLLIASEEWSYMFLSAGFSSVGTFFFLSGFFLCLTLSREKRGGPIVFIIAVIQRFISRKMLAVGAFILLSFLGCAIGTWAVASSDLLPFMIFPGPVLQSASKVRFGLDGQLGTETVRGPNGTAPQGVRKSGVLQGLQGKGPSGAASSSQLGGAHKRSNGDA
ncbi:nose resistant to fluoxetine protein 6-like [Dermacentor variabilis]|uniref:nose resistant to fluoxetine protein 6-like n=1 Tax=Dermacentor variabilis TaxID=34621 RepID=UPI003F5B8D7F